MTDAVAAPRKKKFITGPQRTHLLQRIDWRAHRLGWDSNQLKDREPPAVKAARKKVEAWDRRQRHKAEARRDVLHTVTTKVRQFLTFEHPDVAVAVVEQFESWTIQEILDPDVDVFEEVALMAEEMREQRTGGPRWDR